MDVRYEDNYLWKRVTKYFSKDYQNRDKTGTVITSDTRNSNDESKTVKARTLNFMASSALVLCVLHPLDTIRTRKQIYKVYKNSYPYYYNNKYNLFYILKKEKIESIYRGLLATLLTTGVSHGIFRFIYDTLNNYAFRQFNDVNGGKNQKNDTAISRRKEEFSGGEAKQVCHSGSGDSLEGGKVIENSGGGREISSWSPNFVKSAIERRHGDNLMMSNLSYKKEINNEDNVEGSTRKDGAISGHKNMKYYIITSSVSSIISVCIQHPIWLIKTKIECTINLNYKFLNYKNRITSKHYNIFVARNKMCTSKIVPQMAKVFLFFGYNLRRKNGTGKKIKSLLNDRMLKSYKNNFVCNKNVKRIKKFNHLTYVNDNKAFLHKSVKRKIAHNYLLYKYYTLSILERKQMTKMFISNHRKKFSRRYLTYLKTSFTGNQILRIFKREESKNAISTIYNYKNYFQFVYNVYKKEKLFSFYKGFFTSILLTPHVAIQFYVYEYLTYHFSSEYFTNELIGKDAYISSNTLAKALPFLYGVLSKFIAVIFTYPLYTIKVRQQVQMKNYGFLNVVVNIFRLEGIRSFYTGLNMHLLRNCLQNGMLFFIFEYLNTGSVGVK
ncbi:mitochondrial carrier protein, putative [Plasmodium knowlesi strain H]|uniref:Mitochondrial carrier protein, putative n=3 Tax=Plasmodium knowlesi TaxID=5850 RepID=A0A5K1UQQ8_PLAKH|nr:mitochondrial carrier protein, putative [Plasmodium knowlesi strain H]OTN64091.1 putative Mitochondrial carrier protein [Plasmodium knowlesi]CAA9990893.1 mitochondrial carrier protein, putative [Plasmodium knowlesi strain H]SBO20883.1 mitochondrial carrier protein, putative [Plasmodium knowlesi strain H]SBO21336.1 mitochondrial carrier protein, putative [Plasmodium knowlesi strain H]VVS80367.1 mitochondrial carrier protein, putative [Plasmodium knowlesi strain H]|eukprot:XP_002262179.1 mitochondrial carrier protein, putative [Plasmodium knowlesi strain H]